VLGVWVLMPVHGVSDSYLSDMGRRHTRAWMDVAMEQCHSETWQPITKDNITGESTSGKTSFGNETLAI
jgi:hypothetical protein